MIGFASSFSPLTNSSNVGSVLWERFHNQTQDYYYYFICVPPIVWIRESDHHLWSVFLIYLNNVCITIYHSFHGSLKQSIIPFYSEFLPYKRSQAGFDPPKQSATQVLKLSWCSTSKPPLLDSELCLLTLLFTSKGLYITRIDRKVPVETTYHNILYWM